MAKRYYLSPIVGDGTEQNPYRAKVADHGVSHVAVIPCHPDGRPAKSWALCLVAAASHTSLLGDSQLEALPELAHDAKVSVLANAARQRVSQTFARFGVPSAVLANANAYRDIIRGVGQQLQADFSESNFDVSEQ